MIQKLRAVDPDLARMFLDRIELLQEFLDESIRIAEEKECERQQVEAEALRQAEEHLRFTVELEEKRKADEEKAKREREEAACKEKEEIIAKARKLAEEDPDVFEVFGPKVCTPPDIPLMTPDTGISGVPPTRRSPADSAVGVPPAALFALALWAMPARHALQCMSDALMPVSHLYIILCLVLTWNCSGQK
jgi:chemotaxis protein histidine kinase CheA